MIPIDAIVMAETAASLVIFMVGEIPFLSLAGTDGPCAAGRSQPMGDASVDADGHAELLRR
ncbi:hypothetical protein [Rhodococcus maanshanensis]|uniref:hypothetical protein n=1 Tax=Rhodococcus maanshanensis TaxID=183556 RepID=UPI0014765990|nr:hypothetical protein [Rhodococcus maanshanensis]